MVNCNPETVSTDYDTSDRLYFEPLTLEEVLNILDVESPEGVIVQFGGQTPLKLSHGLLAAGATILGTPPDAIDRAEDRGRSTELVEKLGLKQPPGATATSLAEAEAIAARLGFPVMIRPSYVLGGRAMELVHDVAGLRRYLATAAVASDDKPVLLDRFLDGAMVSPQWWAASCNISRRPACTLAIARACFRPTRCLWVSSRKSQALLAPSRLNSVLSG
jgi:carbamoyl-phosphate synthase large subunit